MTTEDQSINPQLKLKAQFNVLAGGEKFQQDFPSYINGLVKCDPGGYVTMSEYPLGAQKVYNFQPRAGDVFVNTFPKSGTTWVQEMVWLLENKYDFDKAKTSLSIRSPFLEMSWMVPKALVDKYGRQTITRMSRMPAMSKVLEILDYYNVLEPFRPVASYIAKKMFGAVMKDVEELDKLPSPRIIKTHLPFYLLPPDVLENSKVVYVARNPKDVIVSYYYFHKMMDFQKFTGDLDTFAEYFMEDKVYGAPYFAHVLDAWSKRHHPNMLFIFYEDLKRNLQGQIQKVGAFLDKYPNDEQMYLMLQHLRLDGFAKNKAVNYDFCKDVTVMDPTAKFIRKGKTGDWKNHFSPELNGRIDAWIAKNLEGTDLKFVTELEHQD